MSKHWVDRKNEALKKKRGINMSYEDLLELESILKEADENVHSIGLGAYINSVSKLGLDEEA